MEKVLLINMPLGALERQALGISLLKSGLQCKGYNCDIQYLNYAFAAFIGYENYRWVSSEIPYTAFAGDWLFTEALYGSRPEADRHYLQEVILNTWQMKAADTERLLALRTGVVPFLQYCLQQINWADYKIVGFTSTFEQNIASLALAKVLKSLYPSMTIVFGGANWEGEMGMELHRQFPFVDFAFSGEADENFPEFVGRIFDNAPFSAITQIPGIIYRDISGTTLFTGKGPLVTKMDELAIPDYSDFFATFQHSAFRNLIVPSLLIETSRGCWWGAKNHCTFCGLNGGGMAFRSKSAERVLEEINYLSLTWNSTFFECVDNILDMKYFQELIPHLAANPRKLQFFYEVKANLNRKQIELMDRAGIRHIQPGIESMNNHVLQLMRKGTTALQNIQLLRLCKEFSIAAEWNVLYGFPGEKPEDYAEMVQLFKSIRFLSPPNVCAPIRLDRFSPYFNAPEKFGLKNLRPIQSISHLYPFPDSSTFNISYYFDFDYEDDVNPAGFAHQAVQFCDEWRKSPEEGHIAAIYPDDDQLLIIDSRAGAANTHFRFSNIDKVIFEYCDEIRTPLSIKNHLNQIYGEMAVDTEQIKNFLDSLVNNGLMIHDHGKYLSLAIGLKPKVFEYAEQYE